MSDEITITESEIIEAAKTYRVILPPDLPSHQQASFQRQAIVESLTREKVRQAQSQMRRDRDAAVKADLERIAAENAERDAKLAEELKERQHSDFLSAVAGAFFNANPHATESDWDRCKRRLIDAALEQRTLERLRGRESEVEQIKTDLKESGKYGGVV